MLGLPDGITTCLFDLDGVLTQTAKVHANAWKQMFDEFLRSWYERHGQPFREFALPDDYDEYVDGKPRRDGVRSFLESRGIDLPLGSPEDSPDDETIYGLGLRKNDIVLTLIHDEGVKPYEGSVRYVERARDAGLRRGVVSSSTNCKDVLVAAGIEDLFEVMIDGIVAERDHLKGKPAPDTFLAAARALGAEPAQAVVFEDALAGVEAGRAGNFGWVVGVDRTGHAEALREHGADIVRRGPRRVAGARAVIGPDVFSVEPWSICERELHLDVLAQTESIFALSNGHIGLRGNLDEGEPAGSPGTFLNSFYEVQPAAVRRIGLRQSGGRPGDDQRHQREGFQAAGRRRALRRPVRQVGAP